MEDLLSLISLEAASFNISEDGDTVLIPVSRTGNLNGEVSFNYFVSPDTAVEGDDFIGSSGTLTFDDQVETVEIPVPIVNDNISEIDETLNVSIGEPSVGAELGLIRTAVITIVDDNDLAGENTISFSQSDYVISENAGSVTITVTRTGSSEQAATVQFSTSDDYARAGKDYVNSSGTLSFAPGVVSQTITVPIVKDDLVELDETVNLSLSNPTGASLGARDVAKLFIKEEESLPYVFQQKVLASGLAEGADADFSRPGPTAFDWSTDGAMFIAKLDGIVRVLENGALLADPFIDISEQVNTGGQRGLLGLAVHPEFPNSPYVYLAFSYDSPTDEPDASNSPRVTRVIKVEADPATGYRTALAGSEEVILETGLVDNFHAAGALKFGKDGSLYFTHGDGQAVGTSTSLEEAELLSSLDNPFGKMFRIDPLTGQGYADNPFYNGSPDSIESKIYNYGFRNPWRFALHPETDEPFIGDVGQATWEEINRGEGEFFGWSLYEGGNGASNRSYSSQIFDDTYNDFEESVVTAPIYAENHADFARAVILGDFYTGTDFPDIYRGALFFTDLETDFVKALVFNEEGDLDSVIPVADFPSQGITYMAMGPDDKLYYSDLGLGEVGIFEFAPANFPTIDPNDVIYRINAGGPEVPANDGGPVWTADQSAVTANGTAVLGTPSVYLVDRGIAGDDTTFGFFDDKRLNQGVNTTGAPNALFTTERFSWFENPNNIGYAFDVPDGDYTVNLYFDELDINAVGSRIFDVELEGKLVLDEFDLFALYGNDTGLQSFTTTVSDGELNLEFLKGTANSPSIAAIEIIAADSPIINNEVSIAANLDAAEPMNNGQFIVSQTQPASTDTTVAYTVSGTANAGSDYTDLLSGTVIIPTGSLSTSIDIAVINDTEIELDETVIVTLTGVTGDADLVLSSADEGTVSIIDDDTAINPGEVIYRINAGGPEVAANDGGPAWAADQSGSFANGTAVLGTPSVYLVNRDMIGDDTTFGFLDTEASERGVNPTDAPDSLFTTERYGELENPNNIGYVFDVPNGDYTVNLYFDELFFNAVGSRIFDVELEGALVLDDFDPFALYSNDTGLQSFMTTVLDGELNLEFLKGPENNPSVTAIEIIAVDNPLVISLIDAEADEEIALLGNGSSIDIDDSLLAGNISIAATVAETSPLFNEVESIGINLNNGMVTRIENIEPYALFSDMDGDFFGGNIPLGPTNTLTLELFSENNGNGTLLDTVVLNFTLL